MVEGAGEEGAVGDSMRVFSSPRVAGMVLTRAAAPLVTVSLRPLSLSQLAKAFAELSETDGAPKPPPPADGAAYDAAYPEVRRHEQDAAGRKHATEPDPQVRKNSTGGGGLQTNSNVVTFSTMYRHSLWELSGPQLATRMEAECKGMHHGHMVQCLVEVWRRLRDAPPSSFVISVPEARGGTGVGGHIPAPTGSLPLFRSDYLLECVLRTLAKINLDSIQHTSVVAACMDDTVGEVWVSELSHLLLQWLTVRVACFSPSSSATFLHLIVQQKLFHADAVLETLCDNIRVHLNNNAFQGPSHLSLRTSAPGSNAGELFGVSSYAVLLDAISRCQIRFMRLLKAEVPLMNRHTTSPGVSSINTVTVAVENLKHPILNVSLYETVVGGLVRGIRDGSLHITRQGSPATFFFLTLALAKIKWFRDDCAEVLLPQLHEAIKAFPGQFLGVVLFLGRREVKVCAVETTELLLQTLLNAMRKRGCRYDTQSTSLKKRHHKLDSASLVASGVVTAELDCPGTDAGAMDTAESGGYDDDDDDDELQLFSTRTCSSEPLGVAEGLPAAERSATSAKQVGHFTTSFIDIGTLPVFLESLNHIVSITMEYCRCQGQAARCSALDAQATALYEALLNDAHAGVKSLRFLMERPGLVEKLLSALLQIPRENEHPFVVEVAYVFTRLVGARRVKAHDTATSDGVKTVNVVPLWQRRAVALVDLLVGRELLAANTFTMPQEVIQLAPRVAAAVETERLQLEVRWNDNRHESDGAAKDINNRSQGKRRRVVKPSMVFSRFASVVKCMKQQQAAAL